MKTLRMLMAAAAVGTVLIVLLTGPIRAQPDWSVIMSGLDNPRGLTFVRTGDDGDDDHGRYGRDDDGDDDDHGWALYVAEAGKGGPGPCAMIRGALQCVGTTGAVSRYHRGYQERVVTGLPSYAPSTGAGATGPHDVSFAHGRGYVTIGLGGPISPVDMRALVGDDFGWIVRFRPDGSWSFDTDVASYEQEANPGGGPRDSNPYGLLKGAGREIVVDAGGNSLLRVSFRRHISTIAIFPSRGPERETDAVPTSVARGRDGAYYVGELTGTPFMPGLANVWRVVPGQEPQIYCSGFNFIIDLDFDRRGNLYVLEHSSDPFSRGLGTLYRVRRDCSRRLVITDLTNPTSVAIGPDGDAYISNFGTSPAKGEVIRVHLRHGRDDNDEDDKGEIN
jgi:hypothetical protein